MDNGATSHKRSGRGRVSPPRGEASSELLDAGGLVGSWEDDGDKPVETLGSLRSGIGWVLLPFFSSAEVVGVHPRNPAKVTVILRPSGGHLHEGRKKCENNGIISFPKKKVFKSFQKSGCGVFFLQRLLSVGIFLPTMNTSTERR